MDIEKQYEDWNNALNNAAIKREKKARRKRLFKKITVGVVLAILSIPVLFIMAMVGSVNEGIDEGMEHIKNRRRRW